MKTYQSRGDDLKKCGHCNGTGSTTLRCCIRAAGAPWGPAKCCACGGSGWKRV